MKINRSRRRTGVATALRQIRVIPSSSAIKGYTDDEATLLKFNDRSNTLSDPFNDMYELGLNGSTHIQPIQPDYDLRRLAHIVTISNILRQCIEAMVINTTAFGYSLEYIGPEGFEDTDEPQVEKSKLLGLLNSPSPGESLREVLERFVSDKETLGFRALEVIRDPDNNDVLSFNHVPAISLRKTKPDRKPLIYEVTAIDPETGEQTTRLTSKRFCRYVQKNGFDTVYFKEWGDPRNIDLRTGLVMTDAQAQSDDDFLATEIIWDEFYSPGSPYGQPRWMGVLPAILGSRESELVNLNFFRENAIPAMAVLVSGGALTSESFDNLSQYITAVRGADAMQRIMVLEASADELGSTEHSAPAPRIEMKPMISERQQDGLFREYDNHNIVKVRSAFRLPPILIGKAEDYTRASALASVQTAENQVFGPERSYVDDIINNKILSSFNARFWRFKSLGPPTTDAEEMSKVIDSLGKQGALTPNVVIKLANKMLGVYIEPVLADWGDYPFSIIESMVKDGIQITGLDEFIKSTTDAVNPAKPESDKAKPRVVPLEKARVSAKLRRGKVSIIRQIEPFLGNKKEAA